MIVDLAAGNPREASMWWFALSPESRDYWLIAAKTDNPRLAWEHSIKAALGEPSCISLIMLKLPRVRFPPAPPIQGPRTTILGARLAL
jgi:hypothetical protein